MVNNCYRNHHLPHKENAQLLEPASLVDILLWVPSRTSEAQFITFAEVGLLNYIEFSNIAKAAKVFEAVLWTVLSEVDGQSIEGISTKG